MCVLPMPTGHEVSGEVSVSFLLGAAAAPKPRSRIQEDDDGDDGLGFDGKSTLRGRMSIHW